MYIIISSITASIGDFEMLLEIFREFGIWQLLKSSWIPLLIVYILNHITKKSLSDGIWPITRKAIGRIISRFRKKRIVLEKDFPDYLNFIFLWTALGWGIAIAYLSTIIGRPTLLHPLIQGLLIGCVTAALHSAGFKWVMSPFLNKILGALLKKTGLLKIILEAIQEAKSENDEIENDQTKT